MQLTIDSSEPLAQVAAVVGALYGVQLVVAEGSTPPAATTRRRGRSSTARPARPARSARRSSRAARGVDAKVVRQWAVDKGMTVSTRGQLSKAVLDAYAADNA